MKIEIKKCNKGKVQTINTNRTKKVIFSQNFFTIKVQTIDI